MGLQEDLEESTKRWQQCVADTLNAPGIAGQLDPASVLKLMEEVRYNLVIEEILDVLFSGDQNDLLSFHLAVSRRMESQAKEVTDDLRVQLAKAQEERATAERMAKLGVAPSITQQPGGRVQLRRPGQG